LSKYAPLLPPSLLPLTLPLPPPTLLPPPPPSPSLQESDDTDVPKGGTKGEGGRGRKGKGGGRRGGAETERSRIRWDQVMMYVGYLLQFCLLLRLKASFSSLTSGIHQYLNHDRVGRLNM